MKPTLGYLLFLLLPLSQSAQVVLFVETFGDPGDTADTNVYDGYSSGDLVFSGTAEIRSTGASDGYAGASGGGNAFLNAPGEYLEIGQLDTTGATALSLRFGALESIGGVEGVEPSILSVTYTTDGTNWDELDYFGPGTNGWGIAESAVGTLPIHGSWSLRFTHLHPENRTLRLDDISLLSHDGGLTAIPEPATLTMAVGLLILVGAGLRRR